MFNLTKYLYRKRLKRKEFAELCGVSVPTLRKVDKGLPVSRKAAEKICAAAGCSILSLLAPDRKTF